MKFLTLGSQYQIQACSFFKALGFFLILLSTPYIWAAPLAEISGFNLADGTSQKISLQKAKLGTVIVFLSSRCPCSNKHLPILEELSRQFTPLGFLFVGVHSNADEILEKDQDYFKKIKLPFPVLQDKDSVIAEYYAAYKTPHVLIISPELEKLFEGGIDDKKEPDYKIPKETPKEQYLKEALTAIQNGKEPPKKQVRVLGCEIKRP